MIKIKIGPYHKRGVIGLEADIRIAFPDNLPPYRKRKKIPTERDGSEKSAAKAKEWATNLAVTIAKAGRPQKKTLPPPPPPRCLTFGEFVPLYLRDYVAAEGLASGTYDLRSSQMGLFFLPLFKDTPLDKIDASSLAKLKSSLAKKAYEEDRSVRQRNDLMHTFYQMLKLAKEWGHLKDLPTKPKRIKAPLPEIEIYTDEELARLKVAAKKVGPMVYLMVLLGCEAGLRVGEMLGLRWSDVDLVAKRLLVRQQEVKPGEMKPPKGQKSRAVALTLLLHDALKAAQHLGERVLLRTDGKPMQRQVIKAWLARAERVGKLIGHKSPHKLRHTFASRLLARGASIKAVQILLGHASLQSTLGYLHLQPTEAEAAIRKLSGDVGETAKEREES